MLIFGRISFFLFCCLVFSWGAVESYARPKEIEMWFLSQPKLTHFEDIYPSSFKGYLVAELECQLVGEYCFDPQYGLYKKSTEHNGKKSIAEMPDKLDHKHLIEDDKTALSQGTLDRAEIKCDEKNKFDIFCGKGRPEIKSPSMEVWVDTSSSMSEFDFINAKGDCYRKLFLKQLDHDCGYHQKFKVMYFDENIKEAGSLEGACGSSGTNHLKNLKGWIERSEAKKIIIITDIYELQMEILNYIKDLGGKIKGDSDPFLAKDLIKAAQAVSSSCQ